MARPTFGLDIAQQPGPQPSPDWLAVSYLDMSTAGAGGVERPLANAVSLYLSNYGGHACLLQVSTGRAIYTFVLDAHGSLTVQLGATMTALTLIDLTVTHAGQPPMAANDYDVAGNEDALEVGAGAFVAITTSDVPMVVEQRRRPLTLAGTRIFDSIGTQIGAAFDGGSAALPAATLYNPATASRETQRTPTVFKYVANLAMPAAVWTPAASRRFRVLGGAITASVAGTASTPINLFEDVAFTTVATTAAAANSSVAFALPGNGYLASAANNALKVSGPAGNATVLVYGTEE